MSDIVSPAPPANARKATAFVLVAVFLDMVGIGIANPVLPVLVGEYTSDPELQSYWYGVLAASYALMQFLCAPLFGAISDRVGRKPVLIASIVGMGLSYILIAIAPSLIVILIARLLCGITGASFSVANAYLADITRPEDRARNFGLIGAAFGLGFIVGPLIGGFFGEIQIHLPFYIAAGLSLLNAIYGWLVVPESLPAERRVSVSLSKANPFRTLIALVRHQAVGTMVIVYALFMFTHMMMIQSWVLFTHFRFGWGTWENGILMFLVGVTAVIVQGGLLGRLVKMLGEERLAVLAIGTNVVVQVAYGLAWEAWMIYAILAASFLISTAGPCIQAIVSKSASPSEQGILLGSLQSIMSLSAVLGPVAGNIVLAQVVHLPPSDILFGSPFFLGAAVNAVAFVLAWQRLYGAKQAGKPK